jgi:hypothetical protein
MRVTGTLVIDITARGRSAVPEKLQEMHETEAEDRAKKADARSPPSTLSPARSTSTAPDAETVTSDTSRSSVT